jgi:hypothetical protein
VERRCAEGSDQAAEPERGSEVPDRTVARVEHLEDRDDDQHVQAAADERLRRHQREYQPGRAAPHGLEAAEQKLARIVSRGRLLDHALDVQRRKEQRASREHAARRSEDDAGIADAHEHARQQRADECAEALDRRRRSVGRNQLLGRSRERRENRLKRGAEERRGDPDNGGQRKDERLARGGEEHER